MGLKAVKTAVLKSSRKLGLLGVVGRSSWRTRRLLILCYHGVAQQDEQLWNPALFLSQDALRRQCELLVLNNCSVLPLAEAVVRLARNDLPPRSVVLTFDDGSYDFFSRAWPVIREFGFPVTVYQTSYYSSFNRPVFDVACSYVLWKGAHAKIAGLDLSTEDSRSAACLRIRQSAQKSGLSGEAKDELLEQLAVSLGVDMTPVRTRRLLHLMTPDELRQILREGVDLQLHTHRHRVPSDRTLFAREISENREFLAAVGQRSAEHFCYPSGAYEQRFLPWLAELGVRSATTCDPSLASSKSHPLLLPRVIVPSSLSDIEFEGWLHGFSQALPRRPTSPPLTLEA